jgi:hypothetical protein
MSMLLIKSFLANLAGIFSALTQAAMLATLHDTFLIDDEPNEIKSHGLGSTQPDKISRA